MNFSWCGVTSAVKSEGQQNFKVGKTSKQNIALERALKTEQKTCKYLYLGFLRSEVIASQTIDDVMDKLSNEIVV